MVKFARRLRGDIFSIRTMFNSGTRFMNAYHKNKQKAWIAGAIFATYVVTTAGRFVPRIAKGINRRLKNRRQRVGRGVDVPKQKEGTLQDHVEQDLTNKGAGERQKIQYTQPVKKDKVGKLHEMYRKGEEKLDRALYGKEILRGEELRLIGQVVAVCKEFNKQSSNVGVTYTLKGKDLYIKLAGATLRVTNKGVYSMVGSSYYERGKMNRSDSLTRLLLDYSYTYINLFVGILMVYDRNLFNDGHETEVRQMEMDVIEKKRKEKELEKQKEVFEIID